MASNSNINDSDDLDDLDYGDDDFDLESTEQSQNSGALGTSTQDIDDDEGQNNEDEEHEDAENDIKDKGNSSRGQRRSIKSRLGGRVYPTKSRIEDRLGDRLGRGQKRKHREEYEPEEEVVDGQDEEENNEERQNCDEDQTKNGDRSNVERCKYWPYCTAGDECSFYHPTKPCRTFPNCRFGNFCLYIHPPCKFLPFCTRSDCPFAHPVKQTAAMMRPRGGLAVVRAPIPKASQYKSPVPTAQASVPKCKYGFKCSNLMCKFSHQASEPCRYGANCLLENCAFSHPADHQLEHQQKKSNNVFKWTAKS